MKKIVMSIMAVVLVISAGFAFAKDYTVKKELNDITVIFQNDKNPPVNGENKALIIIQDKTGAYVTDAAVVVEYSMPAMPGMPAMSHKTTAALKDKQYTATIDFMMSGAWNINIKITREGKTESAKFNVDVN
jgi:hypothetical protein